MGGQAVLEVFPGVDIARAALDAVDLAKGTGATIYFRFNGVELSANKDTLADDIVRRYDSRLEYEGLLHRLHSGKGDKHGG